MSDVGIATLRVKNVEDYYGHPFPTDSAPKITRDIFNRGLQIAGKGGANIIEYYFDIEGKVVWYKTTLNPFFDENETLIYIKADSMDITRAKEIEESNKTLLETTPICLKEITKNDGPGYTLRFMSSAGQEQLGIKDLEKLYGGPYPPDFYPDGAKKALIEGMDRVISTGESTQVECEVLDTHGNSVWYLSTFSIHKLNEAGEIESITGSSQNITQRKKAEIQLNEYQEHLEELVEKRTQELEESQRHLIHSEKLASLGKLTGSISHEFNNPVQGIRNVIENLSKLGLSKKDAKLTELGIRECDRMAKMIQGLRDFYKPTSDKFSSIDINQCLDEVLVLQNKSLEEKQIQVNQNFSENIPKIEMVEDQIKQVVLNLIQNAADSISGKGQITLTTEMQASHVDIKIQDTGHGISEEDLKNLFEPFFTTKNANKGTGLGLSISYGIIQDHGGDLEVKSKLGEGATFTISLPIESK